jgi:hypothetical protein
MPRYLFHVIDGRAIIDTEGTEYPDLQHARLAAVQTAGRIIESEGPDASHNNAWRMSVADEAGTVVFSLDFSADLHGY